MNDGRLNEAGCPQIVQKSSFSGKHQPNDDSCKGYRSCYDLDDNLYVGSNSCNGVGLCYKSKADEGPDSCNGVTVFYGLTRKPTIRLTKKPTKKPTAMPSRKPTVRPSMKPTIKPLTKPTASPSRKILCKREDGNTERFCTGLKACDFQSNVTISCGSRNGDSACYGMKDTIVGEDSCNGFRACLGVGLQRPATIGDRRCQGRESCVLFHGKVGDRSCMGGSLMGPFGYVGFPCFNTSGTIDNDSCYEYTACAIGTNVNVNEGSCRGYHSCEDLADNLLVGSNSCKGSKSCLKSKSNVGRDSCNGDMVCYMLTEKPTVSPTTLSPSSSPSKSPSNSLTVSPSKLPTNSPIASPTKSPTNSLSASPSNKPTAFPTETTKFPTSVPTSNKPRNKRPTKIPTLVPITKEPTNILTSIPTSNKPRTKRPTKPTSTASTSPTNIPTSAPTSMKPTF